MWTGKRDFAHLGALDDRAVYNNDLITPGRRIGSQSIGWNWNAVENQEQAASVADPRVMRVLRAWTDPWM